MLVLVALGIAIAAFAVGRRTRYRGLIEGIDAIAFEYVSASGRVRYIAPQIQRILGAANPRELLGELIHPEDRERVRDAVRAYANGASTTARIEFRMLRGEGVVHVRTLLGDRTGGVVRGLMIDTTRQTRQETERQLATVGRLAGGVAHEINTPTQFTQDSLQFVREAITELAEAIERHPEARAALAADAAADLEYVLANVPLALERATNGLDRISTIVRSLRELALPETTDRTTVDLADVLGDTLASARAEYAAICEISTSFAELPRVAGNRNELRRVFLNLLGNAARSVSDTSRRGKITVTTRRDGDHIAIAFADTGTGIPLEIRHLVFEPFFTTRELGKARGQGLAVSRAVVSRHGGTLAFETAVGTGTTFTIRLPIAVAMARAA